MEELNNMKTSRRYSDKLIYTVSELMALGDITPKYLLEPILPQIGCAVLVGKPDTGKSQFARQFCIQITLEDDCFLGFKLNPVTSKALYVATEDDLDSIKFLASRQFGGIGKDYNDNLKFIFADTLDQKEIRNTLEAEMTKEQVDLVVVDSFGDIFNGIDSNNNMAMRNTVKSFDILAKKYDCLILFIHHINKKGYGASPSQHHIQGGSGLAQKVRSAIQLSEGDGQIRHLTVVKGNYCPKKFKSNSIELVFSEETFLFSTTGRQIPTSQIGKHHKGSKSENNFNQKIQTMEIIMVGDPLRHTDLVKLYCNETKKSESTAIRVINDLLEEGVLIRNDSGEYSLKDKNLIENKD